MYINSMTIQNVYLTVNYTVFCVADKVISIIIYLATPVCGLALCCRVLI